MRVDQVGYATGAAKRAYLMSSVGEAGASFAVRRNSDGAALFTATVGPSQGSWSHAFPNVYALDFDTLNAAGSYHVSIEGPAPASSPTFAIGSRLESAAGSA